MWQLKKTLLSWLTLVKMRRHSVTHFTPTPLLATYITYAHFFKWKNCFMFNRIFDKKLLIPAFSHNALSVIPPTTHSLQCYASYCLLATARKKYLSFAVPCSLTPHSSSKPLRIIDTDHCKSGPRYGLPVRPLIAGNQQNPLLLLTSAERKREVMKKAIRGFEFWQKENKR